MRISFKTGSVRAANETDAQKYATINDKLILTITCFQGRYQELASLFESIEAIPFDLNQINPFVDRLTKICDYMEGLAANSYVIRHMHHNLNNDLRNLQEGCMLNDDRELYIETAG